MRGRDLVAGLPKTIEVTSDEIREALSEPIRAIVDRVKSVLEQTPPELSSDIIERGMMLTGGVALLRGLDKLLASQTGIPDPRGRGPAVLRGARLRTGARPDRRDPRPVHRDRVRVEESRNRESAKGRKREHGRECMSA